MVPVGLVVASIGYLLAGWLRTRAMTGILIALVLASFVLTLLAPLFHWPPALLQLSIFEQYGAPLVDGLKRDRVLGQLAVATATLAAAVVRFERKDLTDRRASGLRLQTVREAARRGSAEYRTLRHASVTDRESRRQMEGVCGRSEIWSR